MDAGSRTAVRDVLVSGGEIGRKQNAWSGVAVAARLRESRLTERSACADLCRAEAARAQAEYQSTGKEAALIEATALVRMAALIGSERRG